MSKTATVIGSALAGTVCGMLTRPCCVFPLAMSTFGLTGVIASEVLVSHRPVLLPIGATLLLVSAFITLRRGGGTAAKVITVAVSIAAFALSRTWTGVS